MAAKKKSLHAAERDTVRVRALRGAFVEAVQQEDFSCFKFVDETSTNLTYCRRYARAEGGQRTGQGVPLHGGPNVTLVAALTPHGLQAAMTVSGAVNGDVFAAYLDQVLGPTLVPGDVVVLDNLPAPQSGRIGRNRRHTGCPLVVFAALLARLQPHRTRLQQASKPGCVRPRPVPARRSKPPSKQPRSG